MHVGCMEDEVPRDASRVLVPSPLAALDTSRSGLWMRTTSHSWASLDEPRSTRSVWHGPNETEPFLLNLLVEAEEHRRYNAGARPVACQCGGGPVANACSVCLADTAPWATGKCRPATPSGFLLCLLRRCGPFGQI